MKITVFGLSISSAWGNGHATLLRGLFRALHGMGHEVHFFEHDVPYYAAHRDASFFPFADVHLYPDWPAVLREARFHTESADAAIVTSYCPDGVNASRLVTEAHLPRTIFYDMDTPVTFQRLEKGENVGYLPPEGLGAFDLVLSYTGGDALAQLRHRLQARSVAALYGWVDPEIHHPARPVDEFQADLSYLGTYSSDRQSKVEQLLLKPAVTLPNRKFLLVGAMFPELPNRPSNLKQMDHLTPDRHSAFFSSSRLTLNVTRASMAAMGYCPSGRLFEAAACGTPVVSDWWTGLDEFFEPGEEILIAQSSSDSVQAVLEDPAALSRIGARAKERALDCHTSQIRARQLIELIEDPMDQAIDLQTNVAVYEGA
jgi:spore maturation protein CgeB